MLGGEGVLEPETIDHTKLSLTSTPPPPPPGGNPLVPHPLWKRNLLPEKTATR